ncbi:hypothetical protein [Herbaspirillum sp.]|uniref:hypothetical protein n=1 Tax=Herbaspirillum sp. TaxID=1890675 RepID=UPI001B225927|nr:hypothetical protein [Herbaspirillum sp.]MBO9537214.1 hypothetical protein [Herbaspirillum sp.]
MIAIHTPGFSRIGAKREVDADRRADPGRRTGCRVTASAFSAINGREDGRPLVNVLPLEVINGCNIFSIFL